MGQILGTILGGVHYPRGQTKSPKLLPGRRVTQSAQDQGLSSRFEAVVVLGHWLSEQKGSKWTGDISSETNKLK